MTQTISCFYCIKRSCVKQWCLTSLRQSEQHLENMGHALERRRYIRQMIFAEVFWFYMHCCDSTSRINGLRKGHVPKTVTVNSLFTKAFLLTFLTHSPIPSKRCFGRKSKYVCSALHLVKDLLRLRKHFTTQLVLRFSIYKIYQLNGTMKSRK